MKKKEQPKIAPSNNVKALIDKYKDIEVPYNVWRMFGQQSKTIRLAGNQASFGEDYGSMKELREAVEYYAGQLGGKVEWDK